MSRMSAVSSSPICPVCLERAELDLERARKVLDTAIERRKEESPRDADTAVQHMQNARERHTMIRRGHCYCPEEKTGH